MADSQRIDDLRRRVQRDPTSIAFAQLAEECRRAGHFQEAVDVCRAGLELHPGYLSARVTLGRALIELNDLDTGLAELEHVLKSAPENLAAIRGVAEIHHRQGSLAEALAQYRAALALARNDPDLQRTVDELARQVEPLPPPASADGLSFEQMQQELLQNLAPPPPVKPAVLEAPPAEPAAAQEPALAPTPIASAEAMASTQAQTLEPEPASIQEPVSAEPVSFEEPVHAGEPHSTEEAVRIEQAATAETVRADATTPAAEAEADVAARAQALQQTAVLEKWLEAIHVARAQPRA